MSSSFRKKNKTNIKSYNQFAYSEIIRLRRVVLSYTIYICVYVYRIRVNQQVLSMSEERPFAIYESDRRKFEKRKKIKCHVAFRQIFVTLHRFFIFAAKND